MTSFYHERNVINLYDNVLSVIVKMSHGNPGAATALAELAKKENGLIAILFLDDMKIRGYKIWLGYKDVCKRNIDKFYECIMERSQPMIDYINKWSDQNDDNNLLETEK